ncbi:MAG: hypothetical protein HN764_14655 [Gammaproteobacteria bacterium]|nr:hypothetical protein [Gammaproteobacteria bacterium]
MREIQDLTLYTERGMARIEALFQEKKDKFEERLITFRKDAQHKIYGVRMTVIPTSEIHVNDVHNRTDVKANILTFKGVFNNSSAFDLYLPFSHGAWKPILRGTYSEGTETDYFLSVEILSNGLIELIFLANENDNRNIIYPTWFMGLVCNTLYYLQRVRNATDTHNLEYALEVQINNVCGVLEVDGYGGQFPGRSFGAIKESNIVFPRYSVGPADSFQQLSNVVESDFWNHSGVVSTDDNIQINFDTLIK